jgi:hypothetical protein
VPVAADGKEEEAVSPKVLHNEPTLEVKGDHAIATQNGIGRTQSSTQMSMAKNSSKEKIERRYSPA